jgi:hypothetical protein
MNNAITAPFVRLVSDDGHNVVPRHEALQMAARKDMDLVEVRQPPRIIPLPLSLSLSLSFPPNQNSHYHGSALVISFLHPTNTAFISSKALIFFQ